MKLKICSRIVEVAVRNYDLDAVTNHYTAFGKFSDLVTRTAKNYRPSIYLGGKTPMVKRRLLFLTLAYNRWMKAQGDSRRVYKGDWEPAFPQEQPDIGEMCAAKISQPSEPEQSDRSAEPGESAAEPGSSGLVNGYCLSARAAVSSPASSTLSSLPCCFQDGIYFAALPIANGTI